MIMEDIKYDILKKNKFLNFFLSYSSKFCNISKRRENKGI